MDLRYTSHEDPEEDEYAVCKRIKNIYDQAFIRQSFSLFFFSCAIFFRIYIHGNQQQHARTLLMCCGY